ncbi:MAG: trimethylamine methyltransferase family protein [Lachnospiraceae bacterium]|nr:trimethylamine methyltransferase family protein [Lachnospiraceae bacterium]
MKKRLQSIHKATMRILERTGVKFHHPEAVEILKSNGIRVEKKIAYFTEEQVMEWVKKAPEQFVLYGKNEKYNVTIGGDEVVTAPGYGAPFIAMPDGERRDALIEDYIEICKLFEQNSNFQVNGGVLVQPADLAAEHALEVMYYMSLLYSDKCIMTGAGDKAQMETLMEMAKILFGGEKALKEKPRMITLVNTNTPLQLDKNMTETLFAYARNRQPVVIASLAQAGLTSPLTLAGTIAVANAEVLAAIALCQMVSPGTPVVYGSQSTTADMRSGATAIGSPEGALCYRYGALLSKMYGLPCRGGGSLTDAKTVNAQAGYESMLTMMVCQENHMNFILHSAGIVDGYASMSYEKIIMDFEVLDYLARYRKGFEINEDTIPEDLIHEIGQKGQYLTAEHTFTYCRTEPLTPKISCRGEVEHLSDQLERNIEAERKRLLEEYQMPKMEPEKKNKLIELLVQKGVDPELLSRIATFHS